MGGGALAAAGRSERSAPDAGSPRQLDADLLGLGMSAAAETSGDLLGFGGEQEMSALASLDMGVAHGTASAAGTSMFAATATAVPDQQGRVSPAAKTLGGGARSQEMGKDKKEDMFEMALQRWGI